MSHLATGLLVLFPFGLPFVVMAQDAAAADQGGFTAFIPLILIFFVFYFLVARPQKKHQKEEAKMQSELAKGEEVYTKSGIIGQVVGLTDRIATLEISEGSRMKVFRNQIAGRTKDLEKSKEQSKEKKAERPQVLGRGTHAPKKSNS